MRQRLLLLVVMLLMSTVGLADMTVSHFLLRDKSAAADFLSIDTSTCPLGIETLVSVQAGLTVSRDESTTETPFTSVSIAVWDYCKSKGLLTAEGGTTNQDLRINANLKSASLQATVPLNNFTTGQTIYATVDLVWNGANKADRSTANTVDHSGGTTVTEWSQGAIREAEVAGSVIVDATDYTPLVSIDAFIEKDGTREVTITHQ